jgi:hypothetical protein
MSTRFLSKVGWFLGATIVSALFLGKQPLAGDASSYYGKRTNWDSLAGGAANISTFAFRDANRNGVYDLEDRPMAGVVFELLGPNNYRAVTRSNIDGFGNFKMSVLKQADIVTPGEYTYRAITPPDWELTSANDVQHTSFKVQPGSLADMVSSTPAAPVGFAQSLKIAGRVNFSPSIKVTAIAPSGEKKDISIDPNGNFIIIAKKGTWSIEVTDITTRKVKRAITVVNSPVVLSTIVLGEPESEVVFHTRTLGFDDLITSKSVLEVPSGYGDVSWRNWVATQNHYYEGPGYINNTISGEYLAYNSSGHPAEVFEENPFDFLGAYFGVGWDNAEGETVRLEGWRGDKRVYYDEFELSALGPVYFAANYTDVTRLKFSTLHYWQFVCDDIKFAFKPPGFGSRTAP